MINRTEVMANLNEQIRKSGLKKKYIADKLGINLNTITNWVKGYSSPNINQAQQLKEILHLKSIDELINK